MSAGQLIFRILVNSWQYQGSTHVSAQDNGETDALYQAQPEGHGHLYSQGTQIFLGFVIT
jgi:hypothetical protein